MGNQVHRLKIGGIKSVNAVFTALPERCAHHHGIRMPVFVDMPPTKTIATRLVTTRCQPLSFPIVEEKHNMPNGKQESTNHHDHKQNLVENIFHRGTREAIQKTTRA
ncbi:hypothetical protein VX159_13715 [Dechloromonas sp. ZY10]|uniref:hypothetical protein n=1 Tax=Dechloromonas aquae TaxID=2664436 RepID=UPI003528D4B3